MIDKRTEKFRQEYQGKHFMTKDGLTEFYISDARTYGDVTITFIPSGITKVTKVGNIKNGIPSPFLSSSGNYCPICFKDYKQAFIGSVFKTNSGEFIKITNYIDKAHIEYEFYNDPNHYKGVTTIQNIRNGEVRNPYSKNCVGGYLGDDKTYRYRWLENIWYLMLYRTTEEKLTASSNKSKIKTYYFTKVDNSWKNYSNFANWYMINRKELIPDIKYCVDKDLLYPYYKSYSKCFKIYSPYTCVLLPDEINFSMATWDLNKPELKERFNAMVEKYYNNGALQYDTYCILKKDYLKDPKYINYMSPKCMMFNKIQI